MIKKSISYIDRERQKGKSYSSIISSVFKNALKINTNGLGNVFNGYSLFNKPLLVSYSRSGTNWIRYFIEATTNTATPGETRLIEGNKYYIDRAHAGYKNMHKYNKVLFLVRNYKECIVRHHGIENIRDNYSTIKQFLNDKNITQPANWYVKNIDQFEKFEKEKLIIYYEDLIQTPSVILKQIGEFLNIEESKVAIFIENIDYHKANSIKAYTLKSHKSETQGKASALTFHSDKLNKDEIDQFDTYFRDWNNGLYAKHLLRYEFNNV